MMNRFQSCVACAYAEGAYAYLANSETWRKDIDELGDGLFRYLILELATGENCESWPEAIMRNEIAIYELEQVSAALRATYLQEKPAADKTTTPPLQASNTNSCTQETTRPSHSASRS
jgi:hypothetical protein